MSSFGSSLGFNLCLATTFAHLNGEMDVSAALVCVVSCFWRATITTWSAWKMEESQCPHCSTGCTIWSLQFASRTLYYLDLHFFLFPFVSIPQDLFVFVWVQELVDSLVSPPS